MFLNQPFFFCDVAPLDECHRFVEEGPRGQAANYQAW